MYGTSTPPRPPWGQLDAATPTWWRVRREYSSPTGCTWYQRRDILRNALPAHLELPRRRRPPCPQQRLKLLEQPKTIEAHRLGKARPLQRHPGVLLLGHTSQGSAERHAGREGSTYERLFFFFSKSSSVLLFGFTEGRIECMSVPPHGSTASTAI